MNTNGRFMLFNIRSIFNVLLCCYLAACASSGVMKGDIYEHKPSMDNTKARLIIYRETRAIGYYQTINIGHNLEFNLTTSTYKEIYVEPGTTRISVKYFPEYYHSNISASFMFEEDKTYYLKVLDKPIPKSMREHFNDFKDSLVCELKYLPADLVVFALTGGLVHELGGSVGGGLCVMPETKWLYAMYEVDKNHAEETLINLREATNVILVN